MANAIEVTEGARHELARRYADGEVTVVEIRFIGVRRVTQLLSDLGDIDWRPCVAALPDLGQEGSRAGINRPNRIMRR